MTRTQQQHHFETTGRYHQNMTTSCSDGESDEERDEESDEELAATCDEDEDEHGFIRSTDSQAGVSTESRVAEMMNVGDDEDDELSEDKIEFEGIEVDKTKLYTIPAFIASAFVVYFLANEYCNLISFCIWIQSAPAVRFVCRLYFRCFLVP